MAPTPWTPLGTADNMVVRQAATGLLALLTSIAEASASAGAEIERSVREEQDVKCMLDLQDWQDEHDGHGHGQVEEDGSQEENDQEGHGEGGEEGGGRGGDLEREQYRLFHMQLTPHTNWVETKYSWKTRRHDMR